MSTFGMKLDIGSVTRISTSGDVTLDGIPKINCSRLKYNDFFNNYMNKNLPVIITSISNEWISRKEWITTESGLNYESLRENIPNLKVPVANCSKMFFNSHEKTEINFYDYLEYWKKYRAGSDDDILYLKDWHLKSAVPDYKFYDVPIYFASDWLNEFLVDKKKDDYRFVYMGPKGSWTPFHSDVFSSFSWSTNIFGRKKWLILPPGEEAKLKDSLGNDPFSIHEDLLREKQAKYFIVEQEENESLFVPSGWHHQVWNSTDTISVNHNWFNGCNIDTIWKNLSLNHEKVVKEIEDWRMEDFDGHCQVMLRASYGMNFEGFLDIIEHIYWKRKEAVGDGKDCISFEKYTLSENHLQFDLAALIEMLKLMQKEAIILEKKLVNRIENILVNKVKR